MSYTNLIDEYAAGPLHIRNAVEGMSSAQLDAKPIAGKWSTRQVVCHLADFEPIYADRMKRVIAEDEPTFFGGDPDLFAARLVYEQRDVEEELQVILAVRLSMARILRTLEPTAFARNGRHAEDGLLTLETLLQRITGHITHHIQFIQQKRQAMES